MASPFLRESPIDIGAQLIKRAFKRERVWRDRRDPLSNSDAFLIERYRFSREGLIYLSNLLSPHIANATRRNNALTGAQTLCIALRFFACGELLYSVGDAENLSPATVSRSIRSVCLALKGLLNQFVKFPGHVAVRDVKEGFRAVAGFPDVIGAVDCCQIPISARKAFYSINVQVICDSTCLISNIEAKSPGSVHDSRIFAESALGKAFKQGRHDGLLVGDGAYTCRPYFMTPYPDPAPGPQTRYNAAQALTREPIAATFGHLKGRFQCLNGLRVTADRACDIAIACAVLHNIAALRKERSPLVRTRLAAHTERRHTESLQPDQASGTAVRDRIASQLFG